MRRRIASYAATIALFVLLPRAMLAYAARWRERRLANRFPLRTDDAYFQSLKRMYRGEAAQIIVVPYSYQLSPQATLGLNAIMTRVFGSNAQARIVPSIAFGDEDAVPADVVAAELLRNHRQRGARTDEPAPDATRRNRLRPTHGRRKLGLVFSEQALVRFVAHELGDARSVRHDFQLE